MRAIEKAMVEAINNHKNFRKDNTEVYQDRDWSVAHVLLFGNEIARVSYMEDAKGKKSMLIQPDVETILSWPTPTTISRLRAMGVAINKVNGRVHINGHEVQGTARVVER